MIEARLRICWHEVARLEMFAKYAKFPCRVVGRANLCSLPFNNKSSVPGWFKRMWWTWRRGSSSVIYMVFVEGGLLCQLLTLHYALLGPSPVYPKSTDCMEW